MGDKLEDGITNETTMNSSVVTFDNFNVLKEISNISNLVSKEEFLETVPNIKKVKLVKMFGLIKETIRNEIVQEINSMWELENMAEKLNILEKQTEKFAEINPTEKAWRPKNNDVKGQLRAFDVANLRKQKTLLLCMAQEGEAKVNKLKMTVTAKRGYIKALQMDMQKYQKKNDEILLTKMQDKIKNHMKLSEFMSPSNIDVNDIYVSQDSELDE